MSRTKVTYGSWDSGWQCCGKIYCVMTNHCPNCGQRWLDSPTITWRPRITTTYTEKKFLLFRWTSKQQHRARITREQYEQERLERKRQADPNYDPLKR